MSAKTKVAVSPHIHCGRSTSGIMLDVVLSLLPATVAGVVIFGWRALAVVAVCVACCVGFEALFNVITKREQTVGDLSAVVTGLLLALNLPANLPLWQCAVGALFAIVVVKCLFGGIGSNLVNPAIAARVFMLVAFGAMATAAFPVDATAGATPLASEELPSLLTLFLGNYGGAIGETCTAALLLGGVYLLVRRVISWHIPVVFIGTVFVFSLLMENFDAVRALSLTMAGGVFIGAFFMATDYVTSPSTAWGKVLFALGAGLLTCLIRYFGNYPEGVSFAILFMNILTPYMERWTRKKVFGTGGQTV
ncbi:MAG: Na+-transporting NADH:ubiquinone oxidoreductase subunit D [Ruminococcaceae bacterium]|nr:Na+-transporting NADH:ubiquinone oxidoreductase subunit D [Oscillospiraceae bacterium]